MSRYKLREIENKDDHVYKFEIKVMGYLSGTYEFTDINDARKFYINNYNDNCALILYIDGERIKMIETAKSLQFNKQEKFSYGIIF